VTAEQVSTAAAPDLVIDSATGVDVKLRIAGPGARAYAFLIDWHIRIVLALAWYVIAVRISTGRWIPTPPMDGDSSLFSLVLLPPVAIFFLYHYVLEVAMRGRTPGKRMAGVRITTRDGGAPSVGALLVRNVYRLIDSFPLIYGVGLFSAMFTRTHVRVGDMAAGTLLVYERTGAPIPDLMEGETLDAATGEVLSELLHRWPSLDPYARRRLSRALLTRHGASLPAPGAAAEDAQLQRALEQLARGSHTP
jgi:uncharacterized RDD family membrane protein YckC